MYQASAAPRIYKRRRSQSSVFDAAVRERTTRRDGFLSKQTMTVTSRHKHRVDEAANALVICLKEGNASAARYWATELDLSPGLSDTLWDRLITFSVNCVGLAFPQAVAEVVRFRKFWKDSDDRRGIEARSILHTIVRYLCILPKSLTVSHCTVSAIITGGSELQPEDWAVRLGIKKQVRLRVKSLIQDSCTEAVAQALTCVARGVIERDELRAIRTATQLIMWDKGEAVWAVLATLTENYVLYEWATFFLEKHKEGYDVVTRYREHKSKAERVADGFALVSQAILLMVRPQPHFTCEFVATDVLADKSTTTEYYAEHAKKLTMPPDAVDATTLAGLEGGSTFQRYWENSHRVTKANYDIPDPYERSAHEALRYQSTHPDESTGISVYTLDRIIEQIIEKGTYQRSMNIKNPWTTPSFAPEPDSLIFEMELPEIPKRAIHWSNKKSHSADTGLNRIVNDMTAGLRSMRLRRSSEGSQGDPSEEGSQGDLSEGGSPWETGGTATPPPERRILALHTQCIAFYDTVEYVEMADGRGSTWLCHFNTLLSPEISRYAQAYIGCQEKRKTLKSPNIPAFELGVIKRPDGDHPPFSITLRPNDGTLWRNPDVPPAIMGFDEIKQLGEFVEETSDRLIKFMTELCFRYVTGMGGFGDPCKAFSYDAMSQVWIPTLLNDEHLKFRSIPAVDRFKGKINETVVLARLLASGFDEKDKSADFSKWLIGVMERDIHGDMMRMLRAEVGPWKPYLDCDDENEHARHAVVLKLTDWACFST